jgi:hypothetical protein
VAKGFPSRSAGPTKGIYSEALSAGRTSTLEKDITGAVSGRKPLATKLSFLSTSVFIMERGHRSTMNVVKPMARKPTFLSIRKFTLEKGFIHVMSVGKILT